MIKVVKRQYQYDSGGSKYDVYKVHSSKFGNKTLTRDAFTWEEEALHGRSLPLRCSRWLIVTAEFASFSRCLFALSSSTAKSFRMQYDVIFLVVHRSSTNSVTKQSCEYIGINEKAQRKKQSNKKNMNMQYKYLRDKYLMDDKRRIITYTRCPI